MLEQYGGGGGVSPAQLDALMTENRTHQSEVRMHLCRLSDRLDHVLLKVLSL